jgi:hypothetical protein
VPVLARATHSLRLALNSETGTSIPQLYNKAQHHMYVSADLLTLDSSSLQTVWNRLFAVVT